MLSCPFSPHTLEELLTMSLILNNTPFLNSFEIELNKLYIRKASDPDYSRPLKINNSNPELNPCSLVMYVK